MDDKKSNEKKEIAEKENLEVITQRLQKILRQEISKCKEYVPYENYGMKMKMCKRLVPADQEKIYIEDLASISKLLESLQNGEDISKISSEIACFQVKYAEQERQEIEDEIERPKLVKQINHLIEVFKYHRDNMYGIEKIEEHYCESKTPCHIYIEYGAKFPYYELDKYKRNYERNIEVLNVLLEDIKNGKTLVNIANEVKKFGYYPEIVDLMESRFTELQKEYLKDIKALKNISENIIIKWWLTRDFDLNEEVVKGILKYLEEKGETKSFYDKYHSITNFDGTKRIISGSPLIN